MALAAFFSVVIASERIDICVCKKKKKYEKKTEGVNGNENNLFNKIEIPPGKKGE